MSWQETFLTIKVTSINYIEIDLRIFIILGKVLFSVIRRDKVFPTFFDCWTWHHNDKLEQAIFLVQIIHSSYTHVCFTRSRLHLDINIRMLFASSFNNRIGVHIIFSWVRCAFIQTIKCFI